MASDKKALKIKFPKLKFNWVWFLSTVAVGLLVLGAIGWYLFDTGYFEKSQMTIFENQGGVGFSLNIARKDQQKAQKFTQELGIGDSWQKNMSFKFDQETMNKINGSMPITLDLVFKDKEIDFQTSGVRFLNTGSSGSDYTFASGSGVLKMHQVSDKTFSVSMKDPEALEESATSSGQFYISPHIGGLFQLGQKIDTIDLKVDSGNMAGSIKLK